MRFLKNKIMRAKEAYERTLNNTLSTPPQSPTFSTEGSISSSAQKIEPDSKPPQHSLSNNQPQRQTRSKSTVHHESVSKPVSSTKNISINYGKAISSFATSTLAVPYLQPTLDKEGIDLKDFILFISQAKESIGGISSLRSLLTINEAFDTLKTMKFKKIFRMISEVFIKHFSVNWIIHGKVTHKLVYLKFRSKMLRRVQNPELFTYVKRRECKANTLSNIDLFSW